LVELIKPVDPKLTTNEHLAVLSTGIPTNELHPQNCNSLRLLSETPSSRTATNWTLDRWSDQSQAFQSLNYTLTLLLFSIVMLLTANGIYLNQTVQ